MESSPINSTYMQGIDWKKFGRWIPNEPKPQLFFTTHLTTINGKKIKEICNAFLAWFPAARRAHVDKWGEVKREIQPERETSIFSQRARNTKSFNPLPHQSYVLIPLRKRGFENVVGKGENSGNQHSFQPLFKTSPCQSFELHLTEHLRLLVGKF